MGPTLRPRHPQDYPALKMINWFEWDKNEVEVKATVDWTATKDPLVRDAYTAAIPDWFTFAETPEKCTPAESAAS